MTKVSSTPGLSEPQRQLAFWSPGFCTQTYTHMLETSSASAGPWRVSETTSSPLLLKGNGSRSLKCAALKAYAGTPETSPPSGLPLPFPVPCSFLALQTGRSTSQASSSPLHTLLAQERTRLASLGAHPRTRTPIQHTNAEPGYQHPQPGPSKRPPLGYI